MDERKLVYVDEIKATAKSYCTNPYAIMAIGNIIDRVPAADTERRGRWIRDTKSLIVIYKCSECDRTINCFEEDLTEYPYCHCGCRMGGEKRGDDDA